MATGASGEMHIDPMEQFLVKPLFGGEMSLFTITNATLWMAIVVAVIALLLLGGSNGRGHVPTRLQSVGELMYGFVRQMVTDIAGEEGMKYFPYIFTLFLFILFSNLLGMLPYSFTVTSHIAVTGVLALMVFVTVTAIGFIKHGTHFFGFFWPKDAPGPLRPVLMVIELISYFVRPISHSIRLGANMLAGHAVLKVFAGFVGALGVFGVVPIAAMVGLTAFEFLVAAIQAYVFAILTCVYLNDALHMH
ncbi:ATP synthase F0 subcomplex A subunit [Rubrimonas cliftonensis]|uniref:ATP synthase subunit a n=2 Tax=Rubrimonas cliftonensis TaxID=89524 RepID=A0A1H4AA76_9RHOB|nr:ATP synthase F0 subcomplex A subunit [Rubrimonas cliftonensis]